MIQNFARGISHKNPGIPLNYFVSQFAAGRKPGKRLAPKICGKRHPRAANLFLLLGRSLAEHAARQITKSKTAGPFRARLL